MALSDRHLRQTLAVLLLLVGWLCAARAAGEDWFPEQQINVCTSEYTTMVYCIDRDPSDYAGYEIELFRRVRQQLGPTWEDARLNWTCMDYTELKDHLAAGDGVCDLGVAGIGLSTENLERGLTFTLPTLRAGFKIMVLAEAAQTQTWAFMDAFSWNLWLAIVVTALVVGVVVWALERCALIGAAPAPGAKPPSMHQLIWVSVGRPMGTSAMTSPNFNASLVIMVYSFAMMVLVALYTANTAANLTAQRLGNSISSVSDLPGKVAGTWTEYVADLQKRGIQAVGYPWNSVEDEEAMYAALRRHEIKALVLDGYVLDFAATTRCDLLVVGSEFDQYDQGAAFPAGFNKSQLLQEYNAALVTLKEQGNMERVVEQYVKPPKAAMCSALGSADNKVSFQQVGGLWIVMGAAVGVGCVGAAAHAVAVRTANSRRVPKRLRRGLRRLGLRQATLLQQHNKGLAGATRTFQRKASELEASTAVAVEAGLAGGPATVSLKAKARPGPAWEVAARAGGDNNRPLRAHCSPKRRQQGSGMHVIQAEASHVAVELSGTSPAL